GRPARKVVRPGGSPVGAGRRELMDRMGHSTSRAALLYLHSNDERQHAIAEAMNKLTLAEMKRGNTRPSGTERARRRRKAS
ncbi:MAG: hypothetical protein ACTHJW_08680, partial [Streptosporangiaceae bacterium]